MTFECKDLERALQVPELLPDAREHAKTCEACRRELWLWGEMSSVARGLREQWDTPDLWPKIRQALAAQQKAAKSRGFDWRIIAGIAAMLVVGASAFVLERPRPAPPAAQQQDADFLTEQTLKEVEQTEAAYRASIDKLSRLAQPRLVKSDDAATVADREELLVLDSEITNVRATVSQNRFNARLQTELAVLYRQKQDTLKEILERAQKN
ncbi:MAG TPA: hypothetical protein VMU80_18505 [Bryobacteraceae bacterium]|nr:hypothetical protein [Bryobacteraceae bacterium]